VEDADPPDLARRQHCPCASLLLHRRPPTDLGAIPDHWEASDLEATPRADQNLELLALSVSGTVVARQEIYDRVVRDVTAIRASHVELAGITYFSHDTGNELLLEVDAATFTAIEEHTYHDWDELNTRWRLVNSHILGGLSSQGFLLQFNGIYNMPAVAREYAELTGVIDSEPDFWIGVPLYHLPDARRRSVPLCLRPRQRRLSRRLLEPPRIWVQHKRVGSNYLRSGVGLNQLERNARLHPPLRAPCRDFVLLVVALRHPVNA
jgi:hypothetical protein